KKYPTIIRLLCLTIIGHFSDGANFFLFWAARQDFTQIYGQTGIFGSFVRKTWSKPAEFLRTNGHFCPFCP
ncbi:MAG: hypothetical protein ACIRZ2_08675, partial [Ligilactobacillus ruminis]